MISKGINRDCMHCVIGILKYNSYMTNYYKIKRMLRTEAIILYNGVYPILLQTIKISKKILYINKWLYNNFLLACLIYFQTFAFIFLAAFLMNC